MSKIIASAAVALMLTACSSMPWTGNTSASRGNTTDATTSRSSSASDPSTMGMGGRGGMLGGPRGSGGGIHTPY